MGNYAIFFWGGRGWSKILGEEASKKFNNKCSENSRSQIVFRTDNFQKLSLGAPSIPAAAWRDLKQHFLRVYVCTVEALVTDHLGNLKKWS